MNNKDFLAREVDFLRELPPDEVMDCIEKYGGKIREILTDHEDYTNAEIREALKVGYLSL